VEYVVKLDVVEPVFKGPYGIVVHLHLVIMTTPILHDLVDHELRGPSNAEAFDACLDGDFEAAKEGLVLHHVVRRGEI
jgi:hypothetical protein